MSGAHSCSKKKCREMRVSWPPRAVTSLTFSVSTETPHSRAYSRRVFLARQDRVTRNESRDKRIDRGTRTNERARRCQATTASQQVESKARVKYRIKLYTAYTRIHKRLGGCAHDRLYDSITFTFFLSEVRRFRLEHIVPSSRYFVHRGLKCI